MKYLIERLPKDIILKIIPYTYHLQNKNLLDDIINYKESKTILFEIYNNCWIIHIEYPIESQEDKYWLINDLLLYANDNKASMNGYVDNFYNIFKRNIYLQTNEDVDKYVDNFEKKHILTQINIFLGLLTVEERQDFISKFLIKNEI